MGRLLALIAILLLAPPAASAQQDPFFSVDALNDGLGAPPDAVDRRTPRAAIESFVLAAEADAWDVAAHMLDLADVDPALQPREGAILARYLDSVLDRKAVLDWSDLIERPDALQVLGGQQQAQAGEPRRSLLLRELNLDPVPASIRLERVRAGEDADPQWVFSRETVADLPALYRAYGPAPWEARLPEWTREDAAWGLMWWEFLGLPLLLVACVVLAFVTIKAFDAIREASDSGLLRGLVKATRTPAAITAVTTLIHWVSHEVFVFSGNIDLWLSPLVAIGYVTAALMLVMNGIEAALDNMVSPGDDVDLTDSERETSRATATKLNAAKRIIFVVAVIVGAGIVLSTADVFRGIGVSLLASAGVLGIVLGFAARDVLSNIMASLQIAMNQSARIGDRIMWQDELCYVERIHLTYVQLRNWDDTRVIVPVSEFVGQTFSNWSLQDPGILKILKFKVRPDADLDELRRRFDRVIDTMRVDEGLETGVGDLDSSSMYVAGQDVFGIDVWFSVPASNPNDHWTIACAARERIVKEAQDMARQSGRPVFPEAEAAEAA